MFGERTLRRSLRRASVLVAALTVLALFAASPAAAAGPSVTIVQAVGQPDPTAGSTIEFTATFSAPVTGFDGADVNLGESTAVGALEATVNGGPSVYTVSVSGMTGPGVVIASIPAFAAEDGEGHQSLASTSTDGAVSWFVDHTPPTVTIDAAAGQSDPTSASPVLFTARFSEPVTGFSAGDVVLDGSTAGGPLSVAVEGGPTIYTVAVTGMSSAGTVVASLPGGAALDLGENPSAASTSTDNSVSWIPPSSGGGGAGGGGQSGSPAPTASQPTPSLHLLTRCVAKHPCPTSRSGKTLALRVSCGAEAPCAGTVTIVLGRKTLGTLRLHLAAGATTTLRVPLRRSATRLLAARPKVAAKLDLALSPGSAAIPITLALPAT